MESKKEYAQDQWTEMNKKTDSLAKLYMKNQLAANKDHYTVRLWYEKYTLYLNGYK